MKKQRYIEAMADALSAYTDEHIKSYFERVKKEGITEHGFPRLTANIGILLCRGHRENLLPLFVEMMDLCIADMANPRNDISKGNGNDFSVKELIFCLLEVEKRALVPKEKTEGWRKTLATIEPEKTYTQFARKSTDIVNNWAVFTAVSEWMRRAIGLADTTDFVDLQLSSQTRYIDYNGMYRDPHEPMVYDLVTRGLFCVLLHFGYEGVYKDLIDAAQKKAGLLTLKMQSVTGELPYGGRSAQFMHNEAQLALNMEFEANRYKREGNMELASLFKARAERALENIEYWFKKNPIHHVKNRYPLESGFGCEGYAYFDKYMITAASFLYVAYLFADDEIEAKESRREPSVSFTSEHFHKCFMEAGEYFLEFDLNADLHYDEDGLGRVHKKGAPSPLCLSTSMTATPTYTLSAPRAASMAPGYKESGEMHLALSHAATYRPIGTQTTADTAAVQMLSEFENGTVLLHDYKVSEGGVDITVREAKGEKAPCFSFLAFDFDGETKTEIITSETGVSVTYEGWRCTYETNGRIFTKDEYAENRNGRYRVFYAEAKDTLSLHIAIEKV